MAAVGVKMYFFSNSDTVILHSTTICKKGQKKTKTNELQQLSCFSWGILGRLVHIVDHFECIVTKLGKNEIFWFKKTKQKIKKM